MAAELEIVGISKSFGKGDSQKLVLSDISLSVIRGEFVSIIGPSGNGKTTLFHIVGGLIAPDAGRIVLRGKNVTGCTGHISYMPQSPALLPWRTVLNNVVLAREVIGDAGAETKAAARAWLAKIGLAGYEDSYPHVLSGGMQQRAAFLRALLTPREVMCLDEPFGALDALTRLHMQQWLLTIWEETKRTVLFVTHSIEEAILLSDRVYVLSSQPTKVLKAFTIPYPRPRSTAIVTEVGFARLKHEIYGLLRGG